MRYAHNPILSPEDLCPSQPSMQIECLLNPGVFRYDGKVWMLVREMCIRDSNHTLQQRIGHCFATRNILYDYIVYMFQKQQDAAARFFDEKFLFDRESLAAAARELTDFPAVDVYKRQVSEALSPAVCWAKTRRFPGR